MLLGWESAVCRVILAMCPGLGQTRFAGWIYAASPGADSPHRPTVPAASGLQQGTKVAAGTLSFHVLLTPILMKSCGF